MSSLMKTIIIFASTHHGNTRNIADVVREARCKEIGRFQCKGFDTYGPFKLIGGIAKGHPDQKDIREAVEFYKEILEM